MPDINFWYSLIAVSYTHLDVYKRQMLYTSRNRLWQKIFVYISRKKMAKSVYVRLYQAAEK